MYLFLFEDMTVNQRQEPPNTDDICSVEDGYLDVFRFNKETGKFEELKADSSGNWQEVLIQA